MLHGTPAHAGEPHKGRRLQEMQEREQKGEEKSPCRGKKNRFKLHSPPEPLISRERAPTIPTLRFVEEGRHMSGPFHIVRSSQQKPESLHDG